MRIEWWVWLMSFFVDFGLLGRCRFSCFYLFKSFLNYDFNIFEKIFSNYFEFMFYCGFFFYYK